MVIIKRDGCIQPYNFDKVINAATKAFKSVKAEIPNGFFESLKNEIESRNIEEITVEEIQDIIQCQLIEFKLCDVVESFILYRKKRDEVREKKSDLIKEIQKKLKASDVQNQNANVDEHSFGGRKGEAISVVCKNDALKNVMCAKSRRNHERNEVYIHDLDSYSDGEHNCLTEPLDKVLNKGFTTRQCDVRPAGSINTAMQLVAVAFQLQSLQQFGGVSGSHIDWTMVPFIRKSYRKHYLTEWIKTLDEFYDLDVLSLSYPDLNHWIANKITEFFIKHPNLDSVRVWKIGNITDFDKKLRQRALLETKKETYQAVEGMYHNLNTLQSRSGNQLPFSSLNWGTCTELEGRMVIKALLECSLEGLGPHYTTPIFPCGIFQYQKGVNDKPGTPNYDLKRLAIKSTASRIYPNYANVNWSINVNVVNADRAIKRNVLQKLTDGDKVQLLELCNTNEAVQDFLKDMSIVLNENKEFNVDDTPKPFEITSTMGCRTYNGGDINADEDYFLNVLHKLIVTKQVDDNALTSSAQKDGRGNICPVTVIMPTLAMEVLEKKFKGVTSDYNKMIELAHENKEAVVEAFMAYLDKKIHEAKDMLIERFNHIASQPAASAKFMYENGTMYGYVPEEGIISALKHGTLALGQLSLAETLQILIGTNQVTDEGMALAERIESLFNKRCAEFKKQYKLNFGVYYTPAENLCHTALKNFRKKYGVIKNVSDRDYFTNSIHVPVWEKIDCYKKVDIEAKLTGYSNAGCITYVELPDGTRNNIDALENLVDYMMDKDVPYAAINIPLDTCQECGFTGEFDVCPNCGSTKIDRLRRITGYLTSDVKHFNKGKQAEEADRVKHTDNKVSKGDC